MLIRFICLHQVTSCISIVETRKHRLSRNSLSGGSVTLRASDPTRFPGRQHLASASCFSNNQFNYVCIDRILKYSYLLWFCSTGFFLRLFFLDHNLTSCAQHFRTENYLNRKTNKSRRKQQWSPGQKYPPVSNQPTSRVDFCMSKSIKTLLFSLFSSKNPSMHIFIQYSFI